MPGSPAPPRTRRRPDPRDHNPQPQTPTPKQTNSTAFDIQIDDSAALPEGVALAPGEQQTAASFKKLGGGETAKFSYDVVPSVGGRAFHLPRASVAYTVSEGEGKRAKREGRSTTAAVYVETPVQLAVRHALSAGSYATLGVLRTPEQWRSVGLIAAFVGLVFGGSSVFGKTKEAAATSRRNKALAELENEKTKK
jgi:hypothetical protein